MARKAAFLALGFCLVYPFLDRVGPSVFASISLFVVSVVVILIAESPGWLRIPVGILTAAFSLLMMLVAGWLPGLIGLVLSILVLRKLDRERRYTVSYTVAERVPRVSGTQAANVTVGEDTQPMKPVTNLPAPPPGFVYVLSPQPQLAVKKAKPRKTTSPVGGMIALLMMFACGIWSYNSIANPTNSITNPSRGISDLQVSQTANALGDLIADKWRVFSFVESVGTVSNLKGLVGGNVRVVRGSINEQAAQMLREAALPVAPITEFSVILDDGVSIVSFMWNQRTERFDQTLLTFVERGDSNQSSVTRPTPAATDLPVTGESYTALSQVRVRSCSSTTCEIVTSVPGGTVVMVTGQENGDPVSGSPLWRSVRLPDGRSGFIHSSLLQRGVVSIAPPAAAPPSTNNNNGSGGGGGDSNTSQPPPSTSVPPTQTQWVCEGDIYNCGSFTDRDALMSYFNACPGDPSNLDGNGDGEPCES